MKGNESLGPKEKELFDSFKFGFPIQQVLALNQFAGLKKRLSSESNLVGMLIGGEGEPDAQLKYNLTKEEMESLMKEIEDDKGNKIIYDMCVGLSRAFYPALASKLNDPLYVDYREEIREYLSWCYQEAAKEAGMS